MDADELEPTIAPPNAPSGYVCGGGGPSGCYPDCPSPRYQLNGTSITPYSEYGEDFGLDDCKLLN